MSTHRPILVPTDLSPPAEQALRFVLRLAGPLSTTVHLLHVLDLYRTELPDAFDEASPGSLWEQMEAAAAEELGRLAEVYSGGGLLSVEQRRDAAVVPTILRVAREREASLIVMGTHGRRGVRRFLLGSVAAEVVREAPCGVIVMPPEAEADRAVERLLVPVDFSPFSQRMLEQAKALAATLGARVELLHVLEDPALPALWPGRLVRDLLPELRRRAEEELERLRAEAGGPEVPVEVHLEPGRSAEGILDAARELGSSLIVMGSHGHTGVNRFLLGSVTERVLPSAPCPVLVYRAAPESEEEDEEG